MNPIEICQNKVLKIVLQDWQKEAVRLQAECVKEYGHMLESLIKVDSFNFFCALLVGMKRVLNSQERRCVFVLGLELWRLLPYPSIVNRVGSLADLLREYKPRGFTLELVGYAGIEVRERRRGNGKKRISA